MQAFEIDSGNVSSAATPTAASASPEKPFEFDWSLEGDGMAMFYGRLLYDLVVFVILCIEFNTFLTAIYFTNDIGMPAGIHKETYYVCSGNPRASPSDLTFDKPPFAVRLGAIVLIAAHSCGVVASKLRSGRL